MISDGDPNKTHQDDYLKLMMVFIAANLGRNKWVPSLRRKQLDPEEVAADLLLFLYQKTAGNKFKLRTPMVPVFLQALNTAIRNFLISLVRKGNNGHTVRAASQHGTGDEGDDGSELLDAPAPDEISLRRLVLFLKDSEDAALRDIPGDVFDLIRLYRLLCRWVVRRNAMTPHSQLPPRLRRRVSDNTHGLVSFRIGALIREYAKDPELGADPLDE